MHLKRRKHIAYVWMIFMSSKELLAYLEVIIGAGALSKLEVLEFANKLKHVTMPCLLPLAETFDMRLST